jgi:hypothetical protein
MVTDNIALLIACGAFDSGDSGSSGFGSLPDPPSWLVWVAVGGALIALVTTSVLLFGGK